MVAYELSRRASVKDVIEALGPPHAVVGRLLVNGEERGFSVLLKPGDRVEVFPEHVPVDVTRPTPLKPAPLPGLRFLADANVGRLARMMRMLGLDTAYDRSLSDPELAELAQREKRIVVSKDRNLLKRSSICHAHLVRCDNPQDQLRNLAVHFGLTPPFAAFSRCIACNALLQPVNKQDVLHLLEPLTRIHYHVFRKCPECGRVFWQGSHFERMHELLRDLGLDG